jgi:hypothetical protein
MTAAKDKGPSLALGEVERMREALEKAAMELWSRFHISPIQYERDSASTWALAKAAKYGPTGAYEDAARIALLSEREGERVVLRKRPIAWMRYNCGSAEFQHTTFQRDPPEDEGWIALYRRGEPAVAERSAARSEHQSASPGREERDYNSPAVAAPFDHNKRRGSAMSTAQQILPNLVEELRAEAGMSHGDGAETSLEWIAAARLLEAHVILQTWVNVSADMSADPLPKPLREIQDDEQALLIRAREWCRRMGQVSAEEADRFRWESHDWSPDTHTCRKCGAAISTKEACPFSPAPEQESPADTRDGAVAERSAARSEHPL